MSKSLHAQAAEKVAAENPDMAHELGLPIPVAGGEIKVHKPDFEQGTFAMFFDRRSGMSPRLTAAIRDLQDGDPVLVLPEPELPIRLQPLRFSLFAAFGYFADVDQAGTILSAGHEKTEKLNREHVEAVVFIYLPERLVPARMTFKTTKCQAAHKAIAALKLAAEPGWAKLSPEHGTSMMAPYPWSRFSVSVRTSTRTSRTSGFKYVAADADIRPTGVTEWKLIGDSLKCPGFVQELRVAVKGYDRRLEEVKRAM